MAPEKLEAKIETIKRQLSAEHELNWNEFVKNQELGDCQFIAGEVVRICPESTHIVGEIEVEPYVDSKGQTQTLLLHHWNELDGTLLDFAQGTLIKHCNISNPENPQPDDPDKYHEGYRKPKKHPSTP